MARLVTPRPLTIKFLSELAGRIGLSANGCVSSADLLELLMAKLLILKEQGQFGQKQLSVRQH